MSNTNRRGFLKSVVAVSAVAVIPQVSALQKPELTGLENCDQRALDYVNDAIPAVYERCLHISRIGGSRNPENAFDYILNRTKAIQ